MFLTTVKPTLTVQTLLEIIQEAENAEMLRDAAASFKAFEPCWTDVEAEPDFSEVTDLRIKAELLRLAGFFLSFSGKIKNKKHYQERAKNLLTQAIDLFAEQELPDKHDEAQVMLALCYWYAGDPINCEDILSQVEEKYADKPLDSAYLQVKITRAITHWTKKEFGKALAMVESLSEKMQFLNDKRLQHSYHNQAGAMYLAKGQYDKALYHFEKGITYAIESGSRTFEGSQYNNIAILYQVLGAKEPDYYEKAYDYVSKALKIFEEMDAPGWTAVILDTQAGILLQQEKFDEAYRTICRAIEMMREGDDYSVLVDALYMRFEILTKKGKVLEAMRDFVELTDIARIQIGEFKVEQFVKKYKDLVYLRKFLPLTKELHVYKKFLVSEALVKNNFHRENSARDLGITRAGLFEIIEEQHPELYEELNFSKRDWSPSRGKKIPAAKSAKLQIVPRDVISAALPPSPPLSRIQKLDIPGNCIVHAKIWNLNTAVLKCFLLPTLNIEVFPVTGDVIVLCDETISIFDKEDLTVAQHIQSKNYIFAFGSREEENHKNHLVEYTSNSVCPLDDYKIFGKIIGYCPLDDATGRIIIFRSL